MESDEELNDSAPSNPYSRDIKPSLRYDKHTSVTSRSPAEIASATSSINAVEDKPVTYVPKSRSLESPDMKLKSPEHGPTHNVIPTQTPPSVRFRNLTEMEEKESLTNLDKSSHRGSGSPLDETDLVVHRHIYTQKEFEENYTSIPKEDQTLKQRIIQTLTPKSRNPCDILKGIFPIVGVLASYNFRTMLLPDVLAGLTVAVLHVPMGMGFAILASLNPIYGLYTSFYPLIFYAMFGNSAHSSWGTHAIIAMLTGVVVDKESTFFQEITGINVTETTTIHGNSSLPIPVSQELLQHNASTAAALSFVVGAILLVMTVLRLGFVTAYFSDSFISGFAFGCCMHIAAGQIPKVLGITLPARMGLFKLVFIVGDIIRLIPNTNVVTLFISLGSFVVLYFVNTQVNGRYKDRLPTPIPIELIVVVIMTIVSYFANFEVEYSVSIIDDIPSGLQPPAFPRLTSMPKYIVNGIVLALLIFVISIVMAQLAAYQCDYSITSNQEIFAYGMTNILSSMFWCFPSCLALSRTMLLVSVKARTLINGLVSAIVVLLVLLFFGKFLRTLPVCVLSALIFVALKGLFLKILDIRTYWNTNKFDLVIWMCTVLSICVLDIDIGLGIGVCVSFFTMILYHQRPAWSLLGRSDTEDLLVDVSKQQHAEEIPGVKIFRFSSPLFYANSEMFWKAIQKVVPVERGANTKQEKNGDEEGGNMDKVDHDVDDCDDEERKDNMDEVDECSGLNPSHLAVDGGEVVNKSASSTGRYSMDYDTASLNLIFEDPLAAPEKEPEPPKIRFFILDCSMISYIDITGVKTLQRSIAYCEKGGISVILAGCPARMLKTLFTMEYYRDMDHKMFYISVVDAVRFIENCNESLV